MLRDASVPLHLEPRELAPRELDGIRFQAARWSGEELATLGRHLARVEPPRDLADDRLLQIWEHVVDELRDRRGELHQQIAEPLARLCRLSTKGLEAGIEALLKGMVGEPARRLFDAARPITEPGFVAVFLASNLPGLAVQTLLPALATRRPVLFKSPSSEPLFTPFLIDALCRHEPRLRDTLAAITWPGGDEHRERPVIDKAQRVLTYGNQRTIDALYRRAGSKLLTFGPKLSLAVVDDTVDRYQVAAALARDIVLFDQRGCLSIQAIFTTQDARALACALADALVEAAASCPPGAIDPGEAAAVQQLRGEALMRGAFVPDLPLASGTVVVENQPRLALSPGLRSVRIYPLEDLGELPSRLAPWQGKVQGVALAGSSARALEPSLLRLGVSRLAPPGALNETDATWANGGISPLAALGCVPIPPIPHRP